MRSLLAIVIIIFTGITVRAQVSANSTLSLIQSKLDSMPDGFSISIALIDKEEVSFIGFLQGDGDLNPIDNRDSLFEIGSITKVFTSTVLAKNIVDGIINPGDSVDEVFPYRFNNEINSSYRSLSNHTSGMYRIPGNMFQFLFQYPTDPYRHYSYEMMDQYLQHELKLELPDTIMYSYSNLGAGVLAYALSNKNKMAFDELVKQTITDPYNMLSTTYTGQVSYHGIGADLMATDNWHFDALLGAGGLISSTNDLSRFVMAQFDDNNTELSLTREGTFSVSDDFSIGLGWHILNPNTVEERFWHNGGTGGYTSSMSFRTTNQTGVVILSNISPLHKNAAVIDELCFALLDSLK